MFWEDVGGAFEAWVKNCLFLVEQLILKINNSQEKSASQFFVNIFRVIKFFFPAAGIFSGLTEARAGAGSTGGDEEIVLDACSFMAWLSQE